MEVFVNRSEELAALERWWNEAETSRIALVWGRRRVGKTALIERFASGRRTLFHTASARPLPDELHLFARSLAPFAAEIGRDCSHRPPADWEEALTAAADCAREQPLLLVIDELPELLRTTLSCRASCAQSWSERGPAPICAGCCADRRCASWRRCGKSARPSTGASISPCSSTPFAHTRSRRCWGPWHRPSGRLSGGFWAEYRSI